MDEHPEQDPAQDMAQDMAQATRATSTQGDLQQYDDRPPRSLKVAHLVIGLVYLGIVVAWALGENGSIGWGDSAYVFPVVLVAAGALGLVASLLAGRRRNATGEALR